MFSNSKSLLGCMTRPSGSRLTPRVLSVPVAATAAPADKDHIVVPFIRAATTAPGGLPPAPPPAQKAPEWPDVNVVREHLFSGDKADIELVSASLKMAERYRVRIVTRGEKTMRFIEAWMNAYGGPEPTYTYIGILRSETDEFSTTRKSPLAMNHPRVTFFAAWLSDLLIGVQTPGVAVSCNASRRASKRADTAARNAAAKLEAREALVAVHAKAAEGEPLPTLAAIQAIHACVRFIAALDEDKASRINNSGFSKGDVTEGHYLADLGVLNLDQALAGRRLVRRYQGQIPWAMIFAALDRPAD